MSDLDSSAFSQDYNYDQQTHNADAVRLANRCSPMGLCLCLVLDLVLLALSSSLMPAPLSPSSVLLLIVLMTMMTTTTMCTMIGRYLPSPPVAMSTRPLVRLLRSRQLLSRSYPVRVLL